jgi:hypothetical protein
LKDTTTAFLLIDGGLASNFRGDHVATAVESVKVELGKLTDEVARLLVQLEVEDYNLEEPSIPISSWLCRYRSIMRIIPSSDKPHFAVIKAAVYATQRDHWEGPLFTTALTEALHQEFLLVHDPGLKDVEAVRFNPHGSITFRNTSGFQVD